MEIILEQWMLYKMVNSGAELCTFGMWVQVVSEWTELQKQNIMVSMSWSLKESNEISVSKTGFEGSIQLQEWIMLQEWILRLFSMFDTMQLDFVQSV